MAATEAPPRGRGRPREFDEERVLDALIDLFWRKGYDDASLTDIVEAAGVNKSSLYNAFGSKEELYRRALERYVGMRSAMLDPIRHGTEGLADLHRLFEFQRREITGEAGRLGCLAVNSATEMGLRDEQVAELTRANRDVIASVLRAALDRAAANGEIDPSMIDVYVDSLGAAMLGVMVAARSGIATAELQRLIDSMQHLVASWRR